MRKQRLAALGVAILLTITGCSSAKPSEEVRIVASTPIIADLVRQVGGDRLQVESLVPPGQDPHSYEPTMSTLRTIAYAERAFTNGLLLEDRALNEMIHSNMPEGSKVIELGEASVVYGARHIPLVENAALATTWLGVRVTGKPSDDIVKVRATGVSGPGAMSSFTTGTFGQPTIWFHGDELSEELSLPTNAHTHMSWGLSEPGIYELQLGASNNHGRDLGNTTLTFAVGVEPPADKKVVDAGHMDIAVDPNGGFALRGEKGSQTVELDPAEHVIAVPHTAATTVPAEDPAWRFLGKPGSEVWLLAQAVVGKHVHGEIDPHLWHDVSNVVAYVEVIEHELSEYDPAGAETYQANADETIAELRALDRWARSVVATIPERSRRLVTTHDAYGYLAEAYGLDVSGFVSPNPSLEPSVQELAVLSRTLDDLNIPAVFVEKSQRGSSAQLADLATARGVTVCELSGDVIHDGGYIELFSDNIRTIKQCLDPESLPAWSHRAQIPKVAN